MKTCAIHGQRAMRCAECLRLARGRGVRGNQNARRYPLVDAGGRVCTHYQPGRRHVFRAGVCKCGAVQK